MDFSLDSLGTLSDRRINPPQAMLMTPASFVVDYFNDGRRECDVTVDDEIRVADELGFIPVVGSFMPVLDNASTYDPSLAWETRTWQDTEYTVTKRSLPTPHGVLWRQDRFRPCDEISAHAQLTIHDKKLVITPQDVNTVLEQVAAVLEA